MRVIDALRLAREHLPRVGDSVDRRIDEAIESDGSELTFAVTTVSEFPDTVLFRCDALDPSLDKHLDGRVAISFDEIRAMPDSAIEGIVGMLTQTVIEHARRYAAEGAEPCKG